MDIDAGLINKLKDSNINCLHIILDFTVRYNTHTPEEKTRLERLFVCHATLYNRNDVVKCLQPLKPGGNVNPLTIAVKQNNLELIKLFVDAGYDTSSREGDGFKAACDISAIQLAIKEDNAEAMLIMRRKHDDGFLLCRCSHLHSVKCFKKLFQEAFSHKKFEYLFPLMIDALLSFSLDILAYLVNELKSDASYWKLKHCHLVQTAAKQTRRIHCNQNASQNLVGIIRYLIEQEVTVCFEDENHSNPLQFVLLCIHLSVLTDKVKQSFSTICKLLLDAMKKETGSALPVPMYNISTCVNTYCELVERGQQSSGDAEFCMHLLEMCLAAGVNPNSRTKSRYPLMYKVNHSLNELISKGSDTNWRVCENICVLLFTYGEKPDHIYPCLHTAMSRSFTTTQYLVLQAISMMDSTVLNEFRKHTSALILGERKDEFDCIKWEKSLKELCRCELYKHIPNRRMAAHVEDLPLPKLLKNFLLFR